MTPEQRLAELEIKVAQLQSMLSVRELVDPDVPKAQGPYEDGVNSSATGTIPMTVNGVRYDFLVDTV